MKKVMTLLLALGLAFTLTLGSTGCGKKDDTPKGPAQASPPAGKDASKGEADPAVGKGAPK